VWRARRVGLMPEEVNLHECGKENRIFGATLMNWGQEKGALRCNNKLLGSRGRKNGRNSVIKGGGSALIRKIRRGRSAVMKELVLILLGQGWATEINS